LTLKIEIILLILGTGPLLILFLISGLGFIDIGNAVGLGIVAFLIFILQ